MLQNDLITSHEEASKLIQSLHDAEGLPAVINFLVDYAGEIILAETPEEKAAVTQNQQNITKALTFLEAPYQEELMSIWLNILAEALITAKQADMMSKLANRIQSTLPNFDAIIEGMMARFEVSNPLDYERIPLGQLCKSFQNWAIEAEQILSERSGVEAQVTVYNLAAAMDNAVCLIVVETAPTEEDKAHELKMTLPLSCLSNEDHFTEKHFGDVQNLFNELLATL